MKTKFTRHPVSAAWGDQTDQEFNDLVKSIETGGFDTREQIECTTDLQRSGESEECLCTVLQSVLRVAPLPAQHGGFVLRAGIDPSLA